MRYGNLDRFAIPSSAARRLNQALSARTYRIAHSRRPAAGSDYVLRENDIKAELSYAYLHAVAAQAGFSCAVADRHKDNAGIDAIVSVKEQLDPASQLTEFSLDFQLKSTSQALAETAADRISYSLDVPIYDRLRGTSYGSPRFLLLLQLPEMRSDWLTVTTERLTCQKCAHWVSLYGASKTSNTTSITVYIPDRNLFTPQSLREIARLHSLGEDIHYHA